MILVDSRTPLTEDQRKFLSISVSKVAWHRYGASVYACADSIILIILIKHGNYTTSQLSRFAEYLSKLAPDILLKAMDLDPHMVYAAPSQDGASIPEEVVRLVDMHKTVVERMMPELGELRVKYGAQSLGGDHVVLDLAEKIISEE